MSQNIMKTIVSKGIERIKCGKIRLYTAMPNLMFCSKFAYKVDSAFRSNFCRI